MADGMAANAVNAPDEMAVDAPDEMVADNAANMAAAEVGDANDATTLWDDSNNVTDDPLLFDVFQLTIFLKI